MLNIFVICSLILLIGAQTPNNTDPCTAFLDQYYGIDSEVQTDLQNLVISNRDLGWGTIVPILKSSLENVLINTINLTNFDRIKLNMFKEKEGAAECLVSFFLDPVSTFSID
ncbi:hypothetical protein ACKWTF_014288 [Chironomus riparius]